MAVTETPDDRWRGVGVRLTAAAALVDGGLGGDRAPSMRMGGYVLETGRQVVERLEAVATRIGVTHRTELDEATRERLRAAVRQLRVTNEALITSARRVAWKGHLDVLHAVKLLISRGRTGFYLAINGAGLVDAREPGYEQHLAKTITELGLAGTVFLLDDLTDDELAAYYGHADMAVHPSRLPEPFGYANLEAMVAGAPVIATAHGGPLEYITPGVSGLLVPPGDPAALADAMDRLLADRTLHALLAAGGRASAHRFGLDAMIAGYEAAICAHGHGHGA